MRKPQGSAHLRTVFDQPYVSAAQPYVTACLLAVGLTPVKKLSTVCLVLWCYAAAFMLCNLPVIKTLLAYSIGYT